MLFNEELVFPVYVLGGYEKLWEDHGRIYVSTFHNTYILDDKNKQGNYPIRRLKIKETIEERKKHGYDYHPLFPIKKVITTEDQLIANLVQYKSFIDYNGKRYLHKPTKFYKLTYHKVLRATVSDASSILFLSGINTPVALNRALPEGTIWAGIIRLPGRNVLWELSKVRKPDTRRKL